MHSELSAKDRCFPLYGKFRNGGKIAINLKVHKSSTFVRLCIGRPVDNYHSGAIEYISGGEEVYVILFLAWAIFQIFSALTYEDPVSASKRRVKEYLDWCERNHITRYGYEQLSALKDRLHSNPSYQGGHYNREYLKNLIDHDIDYNRSKYSHDYCYEIIYEVADKEGWVVPPENKTWQEMEPKLWIARWGSQAYYKWMRDRGKTPVWKYPDDPRKVSYQTAEDVAKREYVPIEVQDINHVF